LTKILMLLATSAVLLVLSRFLGPKVSIDPDFSKMDFNCRFDLIVNTNLILINHQAMAFLAIGVVLAVVAAILLIRTWSGSKL